MSLTLTRLLIVTLIVAACGDSPSEPPEPVPTTIAISGYGGTLTFVGATDQLSATVRDQNGDVMTGQSVDWTSSNGDVVTVSGSGTLSSTGPGTAMVTARAGSASDDITVEVDPVPSTATVASGGSQTGTVGEALAEPVAVEVKDAGGNPVEGETVDFSIASGGGSVAPASVTSDADGRATATWTLGTESNAEQILRITSGDATADVSASATPDEPAAIQAHAGDGQDGLAGEPLPEELKVRVVDQYGNGVPEVTVSWSVEPEDGSFESASTTTDADGVAAARWVLEIHAGEKEALAGAEGLGQVKFNATALPNGVITGTVTQVGGFLSPPAEPVAAAAQISSKLETEWAGAEPPPPEPVEPTDLPEFVEGELIVKFRPDALQAVGGMAAAPQTVGQAEIQEQALLSQAQRVEAADRYEVQRVTGVLRTARVRVREGESVEDVAATLRADPAVEWVERNRWVHRTGARASGTRSSRSRPNGEAASLSELIRTPRLESEANGAQAEPFYPAQAWHYELLELPQAWKLTKGDPSVIVAVVDDGIRFDHPDLAPNLTSDGYDFVSAGLPFPVCGTTVSTDFAGDGDGRDPDPTIPFVARFDDIFLCFDALPDIGGHGLHVAGTIAAVEDGSGVVGVAPGVRIRPVRAMGVHGSGSTADIADGILYAAGLPVEGQQATGAAHVINLSLGGSTTSMALEEAVALADQAGSLVIASAGNEATSAPGYPAAYPEALAVTALGPGGIFADSYSNWGSHVELAAPGGDLSRGSTEAWGVVSSMWDFSSSAPTFKGIQGTSMAAPHVAGVAALLFSQDPSRTSSEVRALLKDFSVDLDPAGVDIFHGHGMVNALGALTQGQGIPGEIRVQLRDAATGAVVHEQNAPGGAFRFEGLPDGEYRVYAGRDEFSDGRVGLAPRPWGALGGSSTPSTIVIDGAGERASSFQIALPVEGSNETAEDADALALDGYLNASLESGSDEDYYEVRIPEAGTYTFETDGLASACGFPTGADTVLELFDEQGALIGTNDDIDLDAALLCSRVTASLSPGTYTVRVTPWDMSDTAAGLYRVIARSN